MFIFITLQKLGNTVLGTSLDLINPFELASVMSRTKKHGDSKSWAYYFPVTVMDNYETIKKVFEDPYKNTIGAFLTKVSIAIKNISDFG